MAAALAESTSFVEVFTFLKEITWKFSFITFLMQEGDQNLQSPYRVSSQSDMLVSPPSAQNPQPSCSTNLQPATSARGKAKVGRKAIPIEARDKKIEDARSKGDHETLKRELKNKASAVSKKKVKASKIEMEEVEEKHENEGLLHRAPVLPTSMATLKMRPAMKGSSAAPDDTQTMPFIYPQAPSSSQSSRTANVFPDTFTRFCKTREEFSNDPDLNEVLEDLEDFLKRFKEAPNKIEKKIIFFTFLHKGTVSQIPCAPLK